MMTTESFRKAPPVEQGCQYSQLQMCVKRERKDHTTSRLQQHQQPDKKGLTLCLDASLGMVQARTPTVHRCPKGNAVGGPKRPPQDNHRQTTQQEQRQAFNRVFRHKCSHIAILYSCTVYQKLPSGLNSARLCCSLNNEF